MRTYEEMFQVGEEWRAAGMSSQEMWRAHETLERWFGWRPESAAVQAAMDECAALHHCMAQAEWEARRGTPEEELYGESRNDND